MPHFMPSMEGFEGSSYIALYRLCSWLTALLTGLSNLCCEVLAEPVRMVKFSASCPSPPRSAFNKCPALKNFAGYFVRASLIALGKFGLASVPISTRPVGPNSTVEFLPPASGLPGTPVYFGSLKYRSISLNHVSFGGLFARLLFLGSSVAGLFVPFLCMTSDFED